MAGNGIVLIHCTKLLPPHSPALEKIIHLTVCNCKTSCVFLRCKCRKSGLNCSELCRFDDCHNDDKDEFVKAVDQDMGRVLNTELLL